MVPASVLQLHQDVTIVGDAAAFAEIKTALDAYFAVEAEVIETGNSTNQRMGRKAQLLAQEEAAPLYEALDEATLKLMNINIEKEHEMEGVCNVLQTCAILLMAVLTVCIVVVFFAITVSFPLSMVITTDTFPAPFTVESVFSSFVSKFCT